MLFSILAFFAVGLIVGSFLNVVILRGAAGHNIFGRSRCLSCQKKLSWVELIPIFSFLWQKRRCLGCNTLISWQYPLVELGTALVFSITFWLFLSQPFGGLQSWLIFIALLLGFSAAIVVLVYDLNWQIIPNGPTLILLSVGLLILFTRSGTNALYDFTTALLLATILTSFWYFSRGRWMGLGDAKLISTTSLIIGFPASVTAFLFTFWLGGLVGIILLALRKNAWQNKIPLGPFILSGSVLAYFFSQDFLYISGLDGII